MKHSTSSHRGPAEPSSASRASPVSALKESKRRYGITNRIGHLSVVLRSILHSSGLSKFTDLIRPRARCPDCSRTWHRQTGKVAGEAEERLLREDVDEDVEADPKAKGAIRLEDDDVDGPSGRRSSFLKGRTVVRRIAPRPAP